jgi:hypothetical protein
MCNQENPSTLVCQELSILRPKLESPSTLVCRVNQETRAPHLHVQRAYRIQRHPTSRSSSHRIPNLWLNTPDPLHHVFYFCLNHHRCPSYRTCHIYTMRQANIILHTNKGNIVELQKYSRFEFKHWHVNDSSQSNQGTDHLVSQTKSL